MQYHVVQEITPRPGRSSGRLEGGVRLDESASEFVNPLCRTRASPWVVWSFIAINTGVNILFQGFFDAFLSFLDFSVMATGFGKFAMAHGVSTTGV